MSETENKKLNGRHDDGYVVCWYLNGQLHREDGPAVEHQDGSTEWYLNGERHREGGPSIDLKNHREWHIHGKHHRENGLPAIELPDGTKYWYKHGELHRVDGPAVEWPGGIKEWFLNDIPYDEEEFNKFIKKENLTKKIKFVNSKFNPESSPAPNKKNGL